MIKCATDICKRHKQTTIIYINFSIWIIKFIYYRTKSNK